MQRTKRESTVVTVASDEQDRAVTAAYWDVSYRLDKFSDAEKLVCLQQLTAQLLDAQAQLTRVVVSKLGTVDMVY